jgi:hypothetical protein
MILVRFVIATMTTRMKEVMAAVLVVLLVAAFLKSAFGFDVVFVVFAAADEYLE